MAVVGLAGLAWLAWVLLGLAGYRRHGAPALHDTVGVLQLVFATVAGAGALVALIVAYRRQKIAEADSVHDRTRVFNERFTATATQLGDAQPAVRLAGVHLPHCVKGSYGLSEGSLHVVAAASLIQWTWARCP